jgi:hypothetical protein
MTAPRISRYLALLLLLAGALLAGCGDDAGGDQTSSEPDDVVSTKLDPGEGEPTIPDLPQNDDPAAVQCTGPPEGVFDASATVGTKLTAARDAAETEGCSIRVAMRDGEGLALTEDFRPDRVNVAVGGDSVTEIISIG